MQIDCHQLNDDKEINEAAYEAYDSALCIAHHNIIVESYRIPPHNIFKCLCVELIGLGTSMCYSSRILLRKKRDGN
jgi:hypothetical protein